MGCVQSQHKSPKHTPRHDEEAAAARLLAHQQVAAAKKAAAVHTPARNINMAPIPLPKKLAPETEVMKRATAFDKLHEEAHKAPSLRDVKVVMGKQSQKLLEGFEQKEAEAHAKPQLDDVKGTDVRNSKLFDKLKQYEENDAKVRREPKLVKSFAQREKEKMDAKSVPEAISTSSLSIPPPSMSGMTAVPRPVSIN